MAAAPVTHFEILGKDGERLKDFYKKLFGWDINSDNPMNYGLVQSAGKGIGGGVGESQDGKPMVTFYAEVDDLQATLDKAVAMGGKIDVPVTEIPNMVTFAQFQDIEGNIVGIAKEM
ncbi:MAG: VOC family protein [Ignavibacteria bacterium]|nr:VOC family protein [Ignavibacteria bacterium]